MAGRLFRFVEIGQNRFDPSKTIGAGIGHGNGPRRTNEKRRPDLPFQSRDRP